MTQEKKNLKFCNFFIFRKPSTKGAHTTIISKPSYIYGFYDVSRITLFLETDPPPAVISMSARKDIMPARPIIVIRNYYLSV